MIARFSPHNLRLLLYALCLTILGLIAPSLADNYDGPVFPDESINLEVNEFEEPPPLPKRNPLLQRPKTKQLVFDDLDPVGSVISQSFLAEDELVMQPSQVPPQKKAPKVVDTNASSTGSAIFTPEGAVVTGSLQPTADYTGGEMISESAIDGYSSEMGGYLTGPVVQTFGMGLFDNLTLSAGTMTFKTPFNNGAGSLGISEGINWSTPVTPQGTLTAQFGVQALQGDNFSRSARSQCFITAGIFKRLDFAPLQGGVAVDWMHDHSAFGSVDVKQMRAELSARSFNGMEYGFIGGFDVFQDRPSTPQMDQWAYAQYGLPNGAVFVDNYAAVDVQNSYMLFVRKHLQTGGQVELRCGATEWGDLIISAVGEAAINDRLAVNGGLTVLAPSEGQSHQGNTRESWCLSLGVVLYFRGGAMSTPSNFHRPMFDVAGNHSFFPQMNVR